MVYLLAQKLEHILLDQKKTKVILAAPVAVHIILYQQVTQIIGGGLSQVQPQVRQLADMRMQQ